MRDGMEWLGDGLRHLWMPYAQMKTASPPLPVAATHGSRIVLSDGRELVDGIASWWTAVHGYNHPHIVEAVRKQLETLPHVMFGGLVHEQAARLAERLCNILPGDLSRVFFSESGSVSVEIAMKMAMQYWANLGRPEKNRFVAFENGYHGDTFGTMALVDATNRMHRSFARVTGRQHVLPVPTDDALSDTWESFLAENGNSIAAIVIEPLVQGAGGMLFHPPHVLKKLRTLADRYDILLIFDEIFTGFGRTGAMFATDSADVVPDIITLSKALTGGTLPLAATVASEKVFKAFWSDDASAAFMHGPTYMANPLACAAANASLDIFADGTPLGNAARVAGRLGELERCRSLDGVSDVRVFGAIGVVELVQPDIELLKSCFIERGVWIRPFKNVVYLAPSLNIPDTDLTVLLEAVYDVISKCRARSAAGA